MLKHLRSRTPLLFALFVVFFGIVASEWWGLYARFVHFDKVMHVMGGLSAAWIGLALLQREITHLPQWKQVLVFVSFATLAGVVWEFAEYIANFSQYSWPDLYRYFHGGDLNDTIGDLAADLIGALGLSLWALRKERS
jgi:uncharacterized membrane protein YjdF